MKTETECLLGDGPCVVYPMTFENLLGAKVGGVALPPVGNEAEVAIKKALEVVPPYNPSEPL